MDRGFVLMSPLHLAPRRRWAMRGTGRGCGPLAHGQRPAFDPERAGQPSNLQESVMPRTKILASALALALGGTSAVQAQSFSGVIVFGDSLSDAGNIAAVDGSPATPLGNSFTTNPDPVYAEIVAAAFGFNGAGSVSGGTNYAFGGACTRPNSASFTCVNNPPGNFSITGQVTGYLGANGGAADPNALYMIWGGANDLFTAAGNPATA